jgi:hypothetical protein
LRLSSQAESRHSPRCASAVSALAVALVFAAFPNAESQGIATSTIRGTVRSEAGGELNGAIVRVTSTSTGVSSRTEVRHGRFLVQGLEVGGPYVVEIRQVGFIPQRTEPLLLALGQPVDIDVRMREIATAIDTVVVSGARSMPRAAGASTTIPDSLLHRLPTLDRNVFDFVRLAGQVSTKVGSQRTGLSAAGANLRFNNFLINGADERAVNGNVSSGINGGKSIPIDAVSEYQVLIAPYDVRYGDFTGALVNTVTRAGTNALHGSTFTYWRNDKLARGGDLAGPRYERFQSGLSLGGPIIRDRVHFFIAPEFQRLSTPAEGPYAGQSPGAPQPLRVRDADITRLQTLLAGYNLGSGSAGAVTNRTSLRNLFARVDATVPRWNTRIIAFTSSSGSDETRFSRAARDTFYMSNYRYSISPSMRLASVQVHTDFRGRSGAHNEFQVSHIADRQSFEVESNQPVVRVLVSGVDGGLVSLNSGTAEPAQGRYGSNWSVSVKNEFSLPVKSRHLMVFGAQVERFRIERGGLAGAYGTWTFSNLDSLERGSAERYELRKDFGSASAPLHGSQLAAYVSHDWRPSERLRFTTGLRADVLDIASHAPFNPEVFSIFGRRTDDVPRSRIHWSPRIGFEWDITEDGADRLRGGFGYFTGRPPKAWYATAMTSYGVGTGVIRCGSLATDGGPPPPFVPDYRQAPLSCRGGPSLENPPLGDVDLLDRNLRLAQTRRASLAYDRRLGLGTTFTAEGLVSSHVSDFRFVNLNLLGPQTADIYGRVLYGVIAANGIATPALKSGFSEVIDLVNTAENYSWQLSARLEKRFSRSVGGTASYTFSRVRDVQSPSRVNMPGSVIWADARAMSARHEDPERGVSLNDLPHSVVLAITGTASLWKQPTTLSLYYVGESGTPFTYLATGASRRGDLNADGSNANDPVYVPRDASDTREIIFSGRSDTPGDDNSVAAQVARIDAQVEGFERFIERSACLNRQRGSILDRNSCREPWSHTSIARVSQSFSVGGHALDAELDVFNAFNLLNPRWGRFRVASPRLLEHVGQAPGPFTSSQPVFRFDTTRPDWTTLETESRFQLQLGVRYRF